jgi:hypothetical protein
MQKINVLTLSIDKLLAEARDGDVKEVKKRKEKKGKKVKKTLSGVHGKNIFIFSFRQYWTTFEPVWHMTVIWKTR